MKNPNLSRSIIQEVQAVMRRLEKTERNLRDAKDAYSKLMGNLLGAEEVSVPRTAPRINVRTPKGKVPKGKVPTKNFQALTLRDAILVCFPKGENTTIEIRDALLERGYRFGNGKTSTRQLVSNALWRAVNSPDGPLEKTARGLFRLKTP